MPLSRDEYAKSFIDDAKRRGKSEEETKAKFSQAMSIYDKNNKPKKVKRLSLWQAVNGVGIWNGKLGKGFIIRPGDKFTAYVKNAKIQK